MILLGDACESYLHEVGGRNLLEVAVVSFHHVVLHIHPLVAAYVTFL